MARKRRQNQRRRRGRFSFLLKLLAFVVAAAAMVAALALFFRMDHIVVAGNKHYSREEVIEASGLREGRNLYMLNKFAVKETIFEKLPYVEEVAINRKLPDTLIIEVRETIPAAAIQYENGCWLISAGGKLLEQTGGRSEGCPLVTGEELVEPEVSKTVSFGEEASYRCGVLLELLQEARERDILSNIGEIRMGDDEAVSFTYLDRFTVNFPWTADISYKLESLATVVEYLENNETGRIDLMTDGKASFIPE